MALPVTVAGLWDTPDTLERWARAVDEGPYATLGFGSRVDGEVPELVALLGAVAAWTSRVRIRASLTPQLFNPVQLAKALATVDRVSGGRLEVALGVGGRDDDYRALGVDPATQTVQQVEARARSLRWTWRGDHLTDTVRPIGPTPTTPDGPDLLVTSYSLPAALSAAPWASGVVHVVAGPGEAELRELAEVFTWARELWAERGRPAPRLVASFWFALDECAAEGARAQVRDHLHDYLDYLPSAYVSELGETAGFAGTAGELTALLERLACLGADEVHLIPTSTDPAQLDVLAGVVEKLSG